jgi:succinate dehydrogenase / fumarate reductase cytochrome b subunit
MRPADVAGRPYAASRAQGLLNWFDPRGRGLGMWAFVLNRITGIGLVLYLLLHFVMLSDLARGEAAYDAFIALARTRLFLAFDLVLMAGLLIHGLNGIRVALIGLGWATPRLHKPAFVVLMLLAAVALLGAAWRLLLA